MAPGDTVPQAGPDTRVPATIGLTVVGTAVSTAALGVVLLGRALDGPDPSPAALILPALAPGVGGYLGSGARASLPLTLLASAAPVLVMEVADGFHADTPEPLLLVVPVAQLVGTALVALHTGRPVSDP